MLGTSCGTNALCPGLLPRECDLRLHGDAERARVLELCRAHGLETRKMETSFYLGRERVLPIGESKMARWRKKLFIVMTRNAQSATHYFGLPPNRVVELGAQIQL
jgi:KUP system potassium uptake protein